MRILIPVLLLFSFNVAANPAVDKDDSIALGKKLYQFGLSYEGKDVVAHTVGDVLLTGAKAACINCHKRSGLGSNEGTTLAPPITGSYLFSEQRIKAHRFSPANSTSLLDRPAYTKDSLKATVKYGVDAKGLQLDRIMPVYEISDRDFDNLHSYLKTLSSFQDVGVTKDKIHIATIIDSNVKDEESKLVADVLVRYFNDLNAGTRGEKKRSKYAPIQKEWQYQSYRTLELHIWKLPADKGMWKEKLEEYYKQTPVFAIVSGISATSWDIMDKFCVTHEIPCILPNTRVPGYSKDNFYTLYYDTGPYNDAYLLADYFNKARPVLNEKTEARLKVDPNPSMPINIVQLIGDSEYSQKAAAAFSDALEVKEGQSIQNIATSSSDRIQEVLGEGSSRIIVWEDAHFDQVISILTKNRKSIHSVYIPYFIARSVEHRKALSALDVDIFTPYPFMKPSSERRALIRSTVWARAKGVTATDNRLLANTFASATLFKTAIKHANGNFNRAYIMELLEHKIDYSIHTGIYPKLSGGPNQRYISTGGYIMSVPKKQDAPLLPVSEWITPEKRFTVTEQ